jgi:hypothetical protein
MNPLRLILIVAAVLAALGLVAVGLVLAPPVQQWAVRRALAGTPGTEVSFSSLAFGLGRGHASGVEIVQDGRRLRVARVDVEYAPAAFLLRREVEVRRLVLDGLEVDLSAASSGAVRAGAAGGPAAAPGALAQVRLPWRLVVGEVRAEGRVLLPGPAGKGPVAARFEVTGGGLRPGKEGDLAIRAAVEDRTPDARVTALHAAGGLRVRQAEDLAFDTVSLNLAVDAEGPRLSAANQLRLEAGLRSNAGTLSYVLRLETAAGGVVAPVLVVAAEAPADGSRFTGTWSLRASRAQVEPFFLGGALPQFALTGEGTLTVEPAARAVGLAGRLEGGFESLETLDPALRAIGRLEVRADFDGAVAPGRARVTRLGIDVSGAAKVLEARLDRGVAVDLAARSLELAAGSGQVGRIRLAGLPLAWIRPFVPGVDLSGGSVSGEVEIDGDARALVLRTTQPLRAGGVAVVHEGRLLVGGADVAVGARVRLAADGIAADLTEVTLATAAGDRVKLSGALSVPGGGAPLAVRLEGDADLPRLLEPFVPLGPVRFSGAVDAVLASDLLEVRSARGVLADGRGRRQVAAELERPLRIELPSLRPADVGATEVRLGRIAVDPLQLGEVGALRALGPLAGESSAAVLLVAATGRRIVIRSESPLRLQGLAWGVGADRRLAGVSVRTTPVLDFGGPADWRFTDGGTTISGPDGVGYAELKLEAGAAADGLRAAMGFSADLAALGRQPLFGAWAALGAGRAGGEWRALRAGEGVQVEGRATLNGLVLRDGNQPLPVANLSLRAVRDAAGRVSVQLPLLLDRVGQRTDLRFEAEVAPHPTGRRFEARMTGEQVELADLIALSALARPAAAPVAPAAGVPAATVPDTFPFWRGWTGRLAVDIKSLARGRDWQAHGLGVEATVADAAIRIGRAAATWGERGAFSAQGGLAFRGGAQPYALEGGFSLTEFDVGALLRAFDPERPPVVEGVFAAAVRLEGAGPTLDATLADVRGEFELRSRQGVFRGLRRTTERVSVATRAVDAVAALGSLFGSDRVKGAAEKVAGQAYQVDQLAQALAELPFDQLVVRARREASLDLRVEELSLLSPEVRLNARGAVTWVAGRPLLEQPLALTYQLAARGRIEQTLARLRALDGTKDDLGYARARDVGTITGTVGRPQPNQFFLRLAEAKLGEFLN